MQLLFCGHKLGFFLCDSWSIVNKLLHKPLTNYLNVNLSFGIFALQYIFCCKEIKLCWYRFELYIVLQKGLVEI